MSCKKLFLAVFSVCCCAFAAQVGWEENFDSLEIKRWQTIPQSAKIELKDTLSAVNHVVLVSPTKGQQYFLSREKFVRGDVEIRFKLRAPNKGPQFYYIGFHANQPWTKAVCWLMIQDGTIFMHIKNPEGGKLHQKIGDVRADFFHNVRISQSTGKLVVTLDGKTTTFDNPLFLTEEPMPVFLGANTPNGAPPAELRVEYVKVSGTQTASLFSERRILDGEKDLPQKLEINSGKAKYSWKIQGGFRWDAITHENAPVSNPEIFSPSFAVVVDGRQFYSNELKINGVTKTANGFAVKFQPPVAPNVEISLFGRVLDGNAIAIQIEAENTDGNEHAVQLICPITPSLVLPGHEGETLHFFPWRGGLLGKSTINITAEYGGLAWQQLMFAANPKAHNGLMVYSMDTNGAFKGMRLLRQQDYKTEVQHSEAANRHIMPSVEPLGQKDGLAFYQYFAPKTLKKGEIIRSGGIRLETFDGDWKQPMRQYSQFMRSNMQPVQVPRWFKDAYSIACAHPPFYYDAKSKKYTMAANLRNGEDAVQLAFWDDYVEHPKEQKLSQMQRYQPGDFLVNKSRGGDRAFAEEIKKTHDNNTKIQLYIDHRFCWKETNTAKAHGQDWATMSPNGDFYGYTSGDDLYLMCCYDQDKWSAYLAETCARLVKDLDIDSVYLDELGIAFPCYNPKHSHAKDGMVPVAPQELAKSMTMIRNAMKRQKPDAALMTEHAGSDYLTQFFDGSWDQTFYSRFDFVDRFYGRVCFFRFYFPHFKIAEWGPSKRHARRNLFNGMGMDLGGSENRAEQLLYCRNMKECSDAISSLSPEPLVKTSNDMLLANRFPSQSKTIYTLYNTSAEAITGRVLEMESLHGKRIVELINDNAVAESQGQFNLEIASEDVAMLACFTPCISVGSGKIRIIDGVPAEIVVYEKNDSGTPRIRQTLVSGQEIKCPVSTAKLIIKAFRDGYLVDEMVLVNR